MASLFDTDKKKGGTRRLILYCLAIGALSAGFAYFSVYRNLFQDRVWASKVRRQIDIAEARVWALGAIKQANPDGPVTEHKTFLTNAPACLLKNYKHRPYITISSEFVHLTYGGGLYHWGLTIGPTNLPASFAKGHNVQQWAPGIYYWNL